MLSKLDLMTKMNSHRHSLVPFSTFSRCQICCCLSSYFFMMDDFMKPNENDCCGTGCNPCILDVYETEKKRSKLLPKNIETETARTNILSPIKYSKFSLGFVEQIHDYLLLTFYYHIENYQLKNELFVDYNAGQYFIIKSCLQNTDGFSYISRPYTPLKTLKPVFLKKDAIPNDINDKPFFQIIVKIYKNGLMSQYFKSLRIKDITLWRGPYGNYEYKENKYKHTFMICQGTAIAPMYAIVNEIVNNDEDETKIMLYYCCRSLEDVLFRNELYAFKQYWNFSYEIFLSISSNNETYKYKEPLNNRRLNFEKIFTYLTDKECTQILIAGSEKFMTDIETIVKNSDTHNNDLILFN